MSTIVKRRVRELAIENGPSKEDAETLVRMFSGHSMRSGFATTAADLPLTPLAKHTRHRSLAALMGCVREREAWEKSPLKSVGF